MRAAAGNFRPADEMAWCPVGEGNLATRRRRVEHSNPSGLDDDPNDFVAGHLLSLAQNFTVSTQRFYAFYLLSHGVIKVLLVAGLLRNKLWAYPVSLVVLGLLIIYPLYRFSYTQGAGLIVLTVFDFIVMGLIWHKYRLVRRHLTSL